MKKKRFYFCPICGNLIEMVHDSGNVPYCCGKVMQELEAGVTDGKEEFHVPVCLTDGNRVAIKIGDQPHPMEEKHYIEWIEAVTNRRVIRKYLCQGCEPIMRFKLEDGEELCKAYAYCNLHKLWMCNCKTSEACHTKSDT